MHRKGEQASLPSGVPVGADHRRGDGEDRRAGGGVAVAQQHHEVSFEAEICEYLAAHGWLYSPTDAGYDRALALFPEDVFGWLAETQPEQLAKRVKPELTGDARAKAEQGVLATLAKALDADLKANGGTLAVLRRGFKDLNAQFQMCQFRPNTSLNESTKKKYEAVRLRVMRQVHYSAQKPGDSIDLVFFVNGIPVATAELKTDFTQNITDAVLQYKNDRPPQGRAAAAVRVAGAGALRGLQLRDSDDHQARRQGHLLPAVQPGQRPPRREPGQPRRLPDGLPVGVDPGPRHLVGHPGPVHAPARRGQDQPRHRQEDPQADHAVPPLPPVGGRHPARRGRPHPGAGTSVSDPALSRVAARRTSISWLTHRLSVLHDENNKALFDSVIVITDRNVLDAQLQEAIRQIDSTPGVIAHIEGLGGSKSQELADALGSGTKIIIVTIQTFPFALDVIQTEAALAGKSFAIVADEAHSSQAGEASKKLKAP